MTIHKDTISDEELSSLPDDNELAFVEYEKKLGERTRYSANAEDSVLERKYVNHLLAFIDHYNLGVEIDFHVPEEDNKFWVWYHRFLSKVDSYTLKVRLTHTRGGGKGIATTICFSSSYKTEISRLLNKIRKIINAADLPATKKDAIYHVIEALQLEVDRDRTRMDALFSRWLDFTEVIGESAENIEPLIKVIERVYKAIGRAKIDHDNGKLPPPSELEKLPKPEEVCDLDDDIPF